MTGPVGEMRAERRKHLIKKALFSLFAAAVSLASLVLVLYVVELCLYLRDSRLPFNGKADGQLYTWGHPIENNRYGFREREFASPKPPGAYRIMVLGDSFTWGAGLAVDERYTSVAETLLNDSPTYPPPRRFEILNFGVFGIPTTRQKDILEEYRTVVEPDLIVVGFCFNDPQPRPRWYSVERERLASSTTATLIEYARILMHAAGLHRVSRLPEKGFYALAERTGRMPPWQVALQRTYETSSTEWRDFVQALRDIKGTSDQMGLPPPIFAVLNHGVHGSDYSTHPPYLEQYLGWFRQAEDAAREAGFVAYNHETEIPRELGHESLRVNYRDSHPSAALNRVYGEKLALKIAEGIGKDRGR